MLNRERCSDGVSAELTLQQQICRRLIDWLLKMFSKHFISYSTMQIHIARHILHSNSAFSFHHLFPLRDLLRLFLSLSLSHAFTRTRSLPATEPRHIRTGDAGLRGLLPDANLLLEHISFTVPLCRLAARQADRSGRQTQSTGQTSFAAQPAVRQTDQPDERRFKRRLRPLSAAGHHTCDLPYHDLSAVGSLCLSLRQ